MHPECTRSGFLTSDTLRLELTINLSETERSAALLFCYSASKLDANSIGWLPKAAYNNRHERGELLTLFNNSDLVGFVLMSRPSPYGELRCLQIWVRRDARMLIHGRALIDELERIGHERHCWLLRLWCAEDLAANLFWEALGFDKRGWRQGPAKVSRRHNLWVRRINRSSLSPPASEQSETDELSRPKHPVSHPFSKTATPANGTPN